ncbi:MAG: hypothetical protein V3T72_06090, partial [Thermoanaerobaculia bacterium]
MSRYSFLATRGRTPQLACTLLFGVLVFAAQPLAAVPGICSDDSTNGCDVDGDCVAGTCIIPTAGGELVQASANDIGCMNDVYNEFGQGGNLNCTANDVSVTAVHDLVIIDPCDAPGDTATIDFVAEFLVTATARHDVGVYIAADGGDALSSSCVGGFCVNDPVTACIDDADCPGRCSIASFPYAPDPPWVDIDGIGDDTMPSDNFGYCSPDLGTSLSIPIQVCNADADCVVGDTCEEFSGIQDTCGDINSSHNPLFHEIEGIVVECIDANGDGLLETNACLSWRQPGANDLCLSPFAAHPGAPSKCNCQALPDITVPVPGQISAIDKVTLDADGNPLPGDPTLFDFSLTGPDGDLPDNFQLDDDDPPHASPGLDPDTYSLTETVPDGWTLVSAVCVSDQGNPDQDLVASGGSVTVGLGESLSCTFTNQLVAAAALGLVKSLQSNADEDGSGTVTVGDTLTYSFVATNTGNTALTNVTITDPLPGLSALTCTPTQPATLAPGETLSCTATYVVTQADVDAGQILNTATADSDETGPVTDPETVPTAQNPTLGLVKSLLSNADEDGSLTVTLNDTLTYQFVATNTGGVTLTGVTITDPLPGLSALTCVPTQPSTLAPGASMTCTATYVVTQA